MKFAAYSPTYSSYPVVLVPEFMKPSVGMERAVDSLALVGTVELPVEAVRALANPSLIDEGLQQFAITAPRHAYWVNFQVEPVSNPERTEHAEAL
jgi:hypothetical protein